MNVDIIEIEDLTGYFLFTSNSNNGHMTAGIMIHGGRPG